MSKFVASPYFNQRKDVIRLFGYLARQRPIREAAVGREILFEAVYPGEDFDVGQLRYVMSFLMKLIKRYFAQVAFEEEGNLWQQQLCQALRKRGEQQLFQKEMTKWEKLQDAHPLRNTRFHYYRYLRFYEMYQFESQGSRKSDVRLEERFEELTNFFLSSTLLHGCVRQNQQNILRKDFQITLLPEVLKHITERDYSAVPAVSLYYYAYQALSDPDNEQNFQNLKELIHQHWRLFSENEALDIFLIAVNYCIQKLNRGHRRYIREAFELYKSGVTNGVFIQNGILSDHTYKNVIRLGISLKEFDWVAHFQEAYKGYLHPQTGQNAYRYNLAYFHFQQDAYEEAMPLLQQVEFKDVFSNLDARRMLLRIYFELEEYDALDSLLDSFYTYTQRQTDIGYHRDNYLHLIRFIRKLLRARTPSARQKLLEEVEQTTGIAEKEWLIKKIRSRLP